ncbi:MAG: hypothetical protein ACWGQW_00785 [bacterium]
MIRMDLWLKYAGERLGGMTELEQLMVESAANVLVQASPERQESASYESDCVGALVAIIELARAVVKGDTKSFQAVKA